MLSSGMIASLMNNYGTFPWGDVAFLDACQQVGGAILLAAEAGLLLALGIYSEGLGGGISGNWWIKGV